MADLRPPEVGEYKCPVCNGEGDCDIGWHASIIRPCGNCDGTGYCDWIRNIRPIYYHEESGEWRPANLCKGE
jgi:hypothetical protein